MAARNSGTVGAGIAGDSKDASLSVPASGEINTAYSERARSVIEIA